MTTGIYQIINTVNGWVSIGSSRNIRKRLSDHMAHLRGGYHENVQMRQDANKYGASVFIPSIIEVLPDNLSEEEIFDREKYHTEQAHKNGKCYNPKYPRFRMGFGQKRTCRICGRTHYSQGMCNMHWVRWRKVVKRGTNISAEDYLSLSHED